MKNTKTISSSKNLQKNKLLPLIALLLITTLLLSPLLSTVQGENFSITYTLKMGGSNPTTNPTTYDNTTNTTILDAYDPVYKFIGWNVIYWANFTQMLTPQKNFVIPAGTIGRVELAAIFDTVPKGFDINYVLNGGVNNPSNRDTYFGDNDQFPIDFFAPSKSGYTFAGWTVVYSDGFTSPITTPRTSFSINAGTTEAVTLTAHWTVNTYTISYDPSSGVLAPGNPATYTVEQLPITTIVPPTRDGYNFQRWTATYVNGSSTALPSSGIPRGTIGNIALRAVWTAAIVTYDVHYYVDGTTIELATTQTETGTMASTVTETAVTIPGYTANPATKSLLLATTGNVITFYYTPDTNIEYTVNYYVIGTTVPVAPSKVVSSQTMNTLITENAKVVAGYTVVENPKSLLLAATDNVITFYYNVDTNIEYTVHYYLIGTSTSLVADKVVTGQTMNTTVMTENAVAIAGYTVDSNSKNLTLAATDNVITFYYNVDTNIEYTVHYYLIGTSTSLVADKVVTGQTMNTTVTKKAVAIAGYTADAASKSLTLAATGNEIIFYYDVAQFTITYVLNGGAHSQAPIGYTVDDLPLPIAVPTRAGYPFLHWIATCSNGSQIALTSSAIPAGTFGNIVLSAVWDINNPFVYDITYMLNDGSLDANRPTAYTIENGTKVNSATMGTPTKIGYDIDNWFVYFPDIDRQINVSATGLPAGTIGNIIVVVFWNEYPNMYNIEYELAGGVNTGNREVYSVESRFDIYMQAPTKPGYEFLYWMVTCANGTQRVLPATGIPAGTTNDLKLTAVWNPNPIIYTITYDLAGGIPGGYNPNSYTVTSDTINIPTPIKIGYTFDNWIITYNPGSDLEISQQLADPVIPTGTTGNIALRATWIETASITTYDVHYYITNTTTKLAPSLTKTGVMNTSITENAPNITGYTPLTPTTQTTTLNTTNNKINFYYTPNTNIEYTIHYYYENTTNNITTDKIITGQTMNNTITETAITIPGYITLTPNLTTTLNATNNTLTFYYTLNATHVKTETQLIQAINTATTNTPTIIALDNDITLTKTLTLTNNKQITLTSNKNTTKFYKLIGANNEITITIERGTLTLDGITITHQTGQEGRGISIFSTGTLIMLNGEITGNTATYAGGGVYNNGGIFQMQGGTINNNKATEYGGGIYNNDNSNFTMTSGTITNNTAKNGAGIYNRATTKLTGNAEITNNTAEYGGGGISSASMGTLTMTNNSTIHNNTATIGGGTYISGTFEWHNGLIYGNTAGTGTDVYVLPNTGHIIYP